MGRSVLRRVEWRYCKDRSLRKLLHWIAVHPVGAAEGCDYLIFFLNLELIDQPPLLLGQFGQIVWISSVAFWVFCARLLTSSATTEKLDLDGAERA